MYTHALARPLTRTVVASVVHDADQTRLFGDRLATPRKVAALEAKCAVLAVAAASANYKQCVSTCFMSAREYATDRCGRA